MNLRDDRGFDGRGDAEFNRTQRRIVARACGALRRDPDFVVHGAIAVERNREPGHTAVEHLPNRRWIDQHPIGDHGNRYTSLAQPLGNRRPILAHERFTAGEKGFLAT